MKRLLIFVVAVFFMVGLAGGALAVGTGKKVEYFEKTKGKVVFNGRTHVKAKCKDCHPAPWKMKKGDKMTMANMKAGKKCGACHNGKKTFGLTDCTKCHKK
jgi:c(7)-type cytochrome triheme protein